MALVSVMLFILGLTDKGWLDVFWKLKHRHTWRYSPLALPYIKRQTRCPSQLSQILWNFQELVLSWVQPHSESPLLLGSYATTCVCTRILIGHRTQKE
jgi:hypothetical protein